MTGLVRRRRGRPPVSELTASQRKTLRAIRELVSDRGMPPTTREVADARSVTIRTAYESMQQLVAKGYLAREPYKARALRLLDQSEQTCHKQAPCPAGSGRVPTAVGVGRSR